MKCYRCNGSGVDDDNLLCYRCGGKGEIELTNEEWFNGLSTEEKAEFLIASIKKCKSCASGIGVDEVQHCPFGECGCHFKDEVVEWLKQPHTLKE